MKEKIFLDVSGSFIIEFIFSVVTYFIWVPLAVRELYTANSEPHHVVNVLGPERRSDGEFIEQIQSWSHPQQTITEPSCLQKLAPHLALLDLPSAAGLFLDVHNRLLSRKETPHVITAAGGWFTSGSFQRCRLKSGLRCIHGTADLRLNHSSESTTVITIQHKAKHKFKNFLHPEYDPIHP